MQTSEKREWQRFRARVHEALVMAVNSSDAHDEITDALSLIDRLEGDARAMAAYIYASVNPGEIPLDVRDAMHRAEPGDGSFK